MRLTRRQTLAGAGGILAALAGCTTQTETNSPNYNEQYPFEIDVPKKRHGSALEDMFELLRLTGHAEPEEVAEYDGQQISGEYRSYTDDGTDATLATTVLPVEGESSWDDWLITYTIVAIYVEDADNPPESVTFEFYKFDGEEPIEVSTASQRELREWGEEYWEDDNETV